MRFLRRLFDSCRTRHAVASELAVLRDDKVRLTADLTAALSDARAKRSLVAASLARMADLEAENCRLELEIGGVLGSIARGEDA